MSRAPPLGSYARAPAGPRPLLPATSIAPSAGAAGYSSSSIYDNDDDVTQSLAEFLEEADGAGGEDVRGGDEFGWQDDSAAYDAGEPLPALFRHFSPPSPSPTRGAQQPAYDRTVSYYDPGHATQTPAVGGQRQGLQQGRNVPPIRPMPLRPPTQPPRTQPQYVQSRVGGGAAPGVEAAYRPPLRTGSNAATSMAPVPGRTAQQMQQPVPGRAAQQMQQPQRLWQPELQSVDIDGEEEDEDYWGAGDGDGAFEAALARTQLDFGGGGRGARGELYKDGAARRQGTAPRDRQSTHEAQQQPQVRYLEELDGPGQAQAPRTGARQAAQGGAGQMKKQGIKLRPVSELPDVFRSLWRFGVFNAVQSVCFDTIYHSDENIVVSAPTGAGKTVLFELAILRLFTSSPSSEAKVLYMAPTKSLCSERVQDWKRKFEQGLGWTVQELTGDSDTSTSAWRDFANARIIVTTPEKWDAMTRKWHDHGTTLGHLRLFCVDEVHTVGADVRGAVLEVVVSRMKTLGTDTRFVAVSATVPNVHDVAEWLGTGAVGEPEHEPAKVFQFGEEFRPCKLQKIVVGYPKNGNDFAFVNGLNFKLYELIKQYSSGKPVLVFCNTRKGCLQAAEALAKAYKQALASSSRADLAWSKPSRSDYKTSDKHLAALLENGIATHHAGMDSNDRRLVEKLFLDGSISIACSTSTLAVGVNLPARMVIIRGTKAFIDGQNKEYNDLEVLQMIGRAGRPQFDTTGVACIMTERALESKYSNLVNAQNLLESCLHKSLTEHVNSEITLRTITDVQSGLHWLRSTFLYVRITKNPAHYAIGPGKTSPETRLEEICLEAIKELVDSGVVDRQEDELSATQFGDIMSKFYLSHKTFLALKNLPLKSNMRTVLETLAASSEFSSYRFRQGEKGVLQKYNKNLRFPADKVSSTADRIMILIQLVLEGVPGSEIKTDNINPMLDARAIFSAAVRIAKCMVDLAVEREDGAIRTMLELLRSLNGRCWDNSSFVLRQLEGIGEKSYKILVSNDIKGFDDVRECQPDRLEVLLGRKPPYGRKLVSQAKSLPQFEVDIASSHEEVLANHAGVHVELSIDLRLAETGARPADKKGNLKLWAYIATTTSDSEFVDFRRTRIDHLLKSPKQFDLSIVLLKPSQRIVISASCDSIAGSEVKTIYKPGTKASDFPIPSLGPTGGDGEEEEATPRPRPAKNPNNAATGRVKTQAGRATQDEDDALASKTAPPAPRRRADGKYDCNHACGDKTVCKHLCCREGLDKPPARRANSKTGVSTTAASSKGQKKEAPAGSTSVKSGPPLRIQPTASTGVKLAKNAAGKVVSMANNHEDVDIAHEDALPSLDQLMTARQGKLAPKKPARLRAPPPPASRIQSSDAVEDADQEDQLMSSSPSPPPLPKDKYAKKRTPGDGAVDGGNKRARISVREFASSSPIELPERVNDDAHHQAQSPPPPVHERTTAEETLLLRSTAYDWPSPSPPRAQLASFESDPVDPLAFDSNDLFAVDDPHVADNGEAPAYATSATLVAEEESHPGAETPADDEDDFDAWLAASVVIV